MACSEKAPEKNPSQFFFCLRPIFIHKNQYKTNLIACFFIAAFSFIMKLLQLQQPKITTAAGNTTNDEDKNKKLIE